MILGLFKKNQCEVCGQETEEHLTIDGKEEHFFCRQHLLEKFKPLFLSFPHKIVIREFEPLAACGEVYGFYPKSELEHFGWTKNHRLILEKLVDTISTAPRCSNVNCNNPAQVLYISKTNAPWSRYKANLHEDFLKFGKILCLEHAWELLQISLRSNPEKFRDGGGLWVPYKEDGFYTSTVL